MLGSNPSANSVASTDPNGDATASPFYSLQLAETPIGRGIKALNPGVWVQSPRKDAPAPITSFGSRAHSHNACIALFATIDPRDGRWLARDSEPDGTHNLQRGS